MASVLQLVQEAVTPMSVLDLPERSEVPLANRRSLPRINTRFLVTTNQMTLMGVDLSFGGMLVLGEEPIWPGNVLELRIVLPSQDADDAAIFATARVVELVSYRGKVGMRMRFDELAPAGAQRIAAFMARLNG